MPIVASGWKKTSNTWNTRYEVNVPNYLLAFEKLKTLNHHTSENNNTNIHINSEI